MKIGDSIRRKGREDAVIKSIIWTSIIEVYKDIKQADIAPYLESISVSGKTVLIKTKKPIINTELGNIRREIQELSEKRLLKIGIKLCEIQLKFY